MIFLKSVALETFKGIDRLLCDFDDLTLLAGLNNSGKTSLLQAVYLLTSVLPPLADHPQLANPDSRQRAVDLSSPINRLGLPTFDWLLQSPVTPFKLSGTFWNDCTVRVEMISRGTFTFGVTIGQESPDVDSVRWLLRELAPLSAEFLRPPGVLSSKEMMLNCDQYKSYVASGQGNMYWRNSIWWAIQAGGGPESFEPVRQLVRKHFPEVILHHPTLGTEGQTSITIGYEEPGRRACDIAQSGAGLHTFLSLAQVVQQSKSQLVLLDEPDAHLHASQQALVLELLTTIAAGTDRQVLMATHAPEMISRVPSESVRWIQRGIDKAEGGVDASILMDRLGALPNVYLSKSDFPEVIVYVEGDSDKPIIEDLVAWCRKRDGSLSKVMVVRHKDGRFGAVALQAIVRTAEEMKVRTRVVGIRDLDWYYDECADLPPPASSSSRKGSGYLLLTLMCKELENLLCDPALLEGAIPFCGRLRRRIFDVCRHIRRGGDDGE
ncbi:MAG: ATP-dependent nuclease [Planctomycetales bacterium]